MDEKASPSSRQQEMKAQQVSVQTMMVWASAPVSLELLLARSMLLACNSPTGREQTGAESN